MKSFWIIGCKFPIYRTCYYQLGFVLVYLNQSGPRCEPSEWGFMHEIHCIDPYW
jgi:hypothetical protein